jgi:hypothetical protein
VIRTPNPVSFFKKNDFSHSRKGIMAGLFVVGIAVCNLSLFFGLDVSKQTEVKVITGRIQFF